MSDNLYDNNAPMNANVENPQAEPQPAPQPTPQPAPQPAPQPIPQPVYQQPVNQPMDNMDYTPVSMWGYLGYQLLFSIPCIGLILALVFAFGGTKNIHTRNLARAYGLLYAISLVLTIIIYLFIFILAAASMF